VGWGENTTDEMCLAFLAVLLPFEGPPESRCPTFQACYDACDAGLVECFLTCAVPDDLDCLQCSAIGLSDCLAADCGAQTDDLRTCVGGCLEEADRETCLRDNCTEEAAAFQTCAGEPVAAGECDANLAQCGIELAE
jgi:hypothetical protein